MTNWKTEFHKPLTRPGVKHDEENYKDLTETGNRARKVSGTQGIFKKIYI